MYSYGVSSLLRNLSLESLKENTAFWWLQNWQVFVQFETTIINLLGGLNTWKIMLYTKIETLRILSELHKHLIFLTE